MAEDLEVPRALRLILTLSIQRKAVFRRRACSTWASSTNTSGPRRSPGQDRWQSSGTLVRHERGERGRQVGDLVRCGAAWKMKVLWPFGVALRGEASNHLMLRWLKTVVVSDEEKAHQMRQVGIRKASVSEPLSKCRNQIRWHRNWGAWGCSRTSLAGARVLARWCPAWRRREPGLRLSRGTWEGGRRYCAPVPGKGRAGERERAERQEPQGAEYRRGVCWRTGP